MASFRHSVAIILVSGGSWTPRVKSPAGLLAGRPTSAGDEGEGVRAATFSHGPQAPSSEAVQG